MPLITYLDTNCLIAFADAEPMRQQKVMRLLRDSNRVFMCSPYTSLETLPLALHYRKPARAGIFRWYLSRCAFISDNYLLIMNEAHRQAEKYGIVGIDACHIAAAVVGQADEFYSFEKPTKPMFRSKEIKVISLL